MGDSSEVTLAKQPRRFRKDRVKTSADPNKVHVTARRNRAAYLGDIVKKLAINVSGRIHLQVKTQQEPYQLRFLLYENSTDTLDRINSARMNTSPREKQPTSPRKFSSLSNNLSLMAVLPKANKGNVNAVDPSDVLYELAEDVPIEFSLDTAPHETYSGVIKKVINLGPHNSGRRMTKISLTDCQFVISK